MSSNQKGFQITWPMYAEHPAPRFSEDPGSILSTHTPQSGALRELSELANVPESSGTEAAAAERAIPCRRRPPIGCGPHRRSSPS